MKNLPLDLPFSKRILLVFYLLVSTLVLLLPALYNGFPLFYSDSAVYIKSAMMIGHIRAGDSIPYLSGVGYALFMRAVSWETTLWLVVFAQALILNILIYQVTRVLLPERKIIRTHLPILFVLATLSSMGWTVSQLMPDFFTSCMVLAVFLFYAADNKSIGNYIFLSLVIILSILSHLSNISISILLVLLLVLYFMMDGSFRRNIKAWLYKTIGLTVLIFASLFLLKGLNNSMYRQNVLSPTGHIFFFARLADTGFMEEFLNEKCDRKSYEICKYKTNFPTSYETFLWDFSGPFYKTGGWDITKHDEYKRIIRDVLTTPKYLAWFLFDCSKHFVKQIVNFRTGDGLASYYDKESSQYKTVCEYFDRNEIRDNYLLSKQIQGDLNFKSVNLVNYLLLGVSVLIITWALIKKRQESKMRFFSMVIIGGVLVNAAATSGMSSVFDRFQSRVVWLIPFLALIYFMAYIFPHFADHQKVEKKEVPAAGK